MGIIQRQATKTSIVNWLGLALGIINGVYVVPHALELYGIYTFIFSIVMVIVPLITMGMHMGIVKFFNEFDDGSNRNRSLFSFGIVITVVGFLGFLSFAYLFQDWVVDYYNEKEPDKVKFLWYVIPLVLTTALFTIVLHYVSNFRRIVVPNIIRNLIKIILPVLLLVYGSGLITEESFFNLVVLHSLLTVLLLIFYLKYLKELTFVWSSDVLSWNSIKSMTPYLTNGLLLSIGGVITTSIDSIMIGSMIEIGESTGVYGLGITISGILIMPNNAIGAISRPIISKGWATRDLESIKSIFRKSSINLFIIGVLLFSGIWVCMDAVFELMPEDKRLVISQTKDIFFFLGVARVFSMACGINGPVLYLSDSYKWGTFGIILLGLLTAVTNYFLINEFGLVGAAMSTAISILIYNLYMTFVLYWKYKLMPWHSSLFFVGIVGVIAILVAQQINFNNPYLEILTRGMLVSILYVTTIYKFRFSTDLNNLMDKYLRSLLRFKS